MTRQQEECTEADPSALGGWWEDGSWSWGSNLGGF